MGLNRILQGLREAPDEGADRLARLGFLEWVMTLPDDVAPQAAAGAAIRRVAPFSGSARAVELFCNHLHSVRQFDPTTRHRRRRGGASARRH